MGGLLSVLATTVFSSAAGGVNRIVHSIVAILIGAILILVGLGFGTAAGYEALADAYGTLVAKLVVGGVFLLVGVLVLLVNAWRRERERRLASRTGSMAAATAFLMGFTSGLGRRRR